MKKKKKKKLFILFYFFTMNNLKGIAIRKERIPPNPKFRHAKLLIKGSKNRKVLL
jgi:hypothetical protein